MLEYISIIITAIFVNNIVFAQFLGIWAFIGLSLIHISEPTRL